MDVSNTVWILHERGENQFVIQHEKTKLFLVSGGVRGSVRLESSVEAAETWRFEHRPGMRGSTKMGNKVNLHQSNVMMWWFDPRNIR